MMAILNMRFRARIILSCIAFTSLVSFLMTASSLRTPSKWKSTLKAQRADVLGGDVDEPRREEEEVMSIPLPVSSQPYLTLVRDKTRRIDEMRQQYRRYFKGRLRLRPSFEREHLSNEERVEMIYDYFENMRLFYKPATPRTTPRRFFAYPKRIPTLPDVGFSGFSLLSDQNDNEKLLCYTAGTDMSATLEEQECVCNAQWKGTHCSIPSSMEDSAVDDTLRARPRRVVYAMALNHEVDHLLTTLSLLWDVVDLFVIGEMNMTQYGDPRPRFFRELLDAGVFQQYERKIFYIPCSFSRPRLCLKSNSYFCDDLKYKCIEKHGISKIPGLRGSDLIIYTDADELVPAEFVHALRYHKSRFSHFAVALNWFMFGCAWKTEQAVSTIKFAATSAFVKKHSLLALRGRRGKPAMFAVINERPAGFHCSWCFDVPGIQLKLISAVNSDYPRWGDYTSMLEVDLIEFLISRGTFFNLYEDLTPVKWTSLEGEPFRNAPHCTRYVFNDTDAGNRATGDDMSDGRLGESLSTESDDLFDDEDEAPWEDDQSA